MIDHEKLAELAEEIQVNQKAIVCLKKMATKLMDPSNSIVVINLDIKTQPDKLQPEAKPDLFNTDREDHEIVMVPIYGMENGPGFPFKQKKPEGPILKDIGIKIDSLPEDLALIMLEQMVRYYERAIKNATTEFAHIIYSNFSLIEKQALEYIDIKDLNKK